MEAKDAIEKVRKALNDLEANGQKLVSTEGLRNFLDSVEKEAGASIELNKLRHESHLTQYKAERELAIELFRSVISSGQHALKTSILVNGGAAVALLAFVSNVWNLANANKFGSIRRVNTLLGLFVPALVTPLELLGGSDETEPE
jgi:hypothetical protein